MAPTEVSAAPRRPAGHAGRSARRQRGARGRSGRARRVGLLAGLLLLAGSAGGCERVRSSARSEGGLDRARFVEVYVDLRRAEEETGSQEEFEARRDEILARHGTSREELLGFVDAHSADAALLAAVWDSIRVLLEDREEGP